MRFSRCWRPIDLDTGLAYIMGRVRRNATRRPIVSGQQLQQLPVPEAVRPREVTYSRCQGYARPESFPPFFPGLFNVIRNCMSYARFNAKSAGFFDTVEGEPPECGML